jgi:hypothetical protein
MAKSEYLQREEAAKKQLGAKGVKRRVKQLPTAARAFTREMTGVDISRKGVSVDPLSVAMALPLGKVLKAAKVLRAAGKAGKVAALESRIAAKEFGALRASNLSGRSGKTAVQELSKRTLASAERSRNLSESVFPRSAGAVGENSREITARLGRKSNIPMSQKRELSEAVRQTGTKFTQFSKNVKKRGR